MGKVLIVVCVWDCAQVCQGGSVDKIVPVNVLQIVVYAGVSGVSGEPVISVQL